MICSSVVLATMLAVASPIEQPRAPVDTVIWPSVQGVSSLADQSAQPGFFDPTRFDSATVISLRAIFDSATARGLPKQPLISRALEGAARHASGSKIVNEVRKLLRDLGEARSGLGEASTESELASGADAVRLGADAKALSQLRSLRKDRGSALNSLITMNDLVQKGISLGRARDAVISLARVSPADDAIKELRVIVAKSATRGAGMAQDAMDRYVRTSVSGAKNAPKRQVTGQPGSFPDEK